MGVSDLDCICERPEIGRIIVNGTGKSTVYEIILITDKGQSNRIIVFGPKVIFRDELNYFVPSSKRSSARLFRPI